MLKSQNKCQMKITLVTLTLPSTGHKLFHMNSFIWNANH